MEADDSFEEILSNFNDNEYNEISKPTFDLNHGFKAPERFPTLNQDDVDNLAKLKHDRKESVNFEAMTPE